MNERPSRLPLYVGVLLILAGWVVLFLGWYQAGRQELETGQLPFVLSGGFGSAGLLLLGTAGVLADVIRTAQWHSTQSTRRLEASIEGLIARLEEAAEAVPDEPESRPRTTKTTKKRRSSTARRSSARSER